MVAGTMQLTACKCWLFIKIAHKHNNVMHFCIEQVLGHGQDWRFHIDFIGPDS